MTDAPSASGTRGEHHLAPYLPPDRFGAIRDVTPIQLGLSGAAVYAVTTDSGSYVLRHTPSLDAAKWAQEIAILRLVSDHGISPRLEHVDDDGRVTVSARIVAPPPGAVFGNPEVRPRALASLVETLAMLHALPLHDAPTADPLREARRMWREQSARDGFPAWVLPLGDEIERCARVLEPDERRVLSHNDMNPGNILWDGERVWLVDWTASGATHPYNDIAELAMFLSLRDDVALALLAAQEQSEITPAQAETFRALQLLARIFFGTIFMSLAPDLTTVVPTRAEDAPTLTQFYGMLGTGALKLQSAEGQAMFGSALFRGALES
jgi:aminoglycoside phosphotransferase (APT) family kinase protein